MAQPVLKCQHLGIQFGGLKAVDDFNMEIGESELVGLIGPNGAGKTTVFNLITGVYKPTEGSLYLNGERMNGKKTHQIVHAGIARTFQNIRLFKKMTVIENVKAAMLEELTYDMPQAIFRTKAYWQQEAAATARAKELLQVVHLSGKEDLEADNLPYGEQRRLEIARALATDMKLLLLDEPAAGMNPTETEELLEIINDFLGKMDAEARDIFVRRYWFFDSVAAIAERHAMSVGSVKMNLYRSRKKLLKDLKKEGKHL